MIESTEIELLNLDRILRITEGSDTLASLQRFITGRFRKFEFKRLIPQPSQWKI
ncbi:hypothetical protein S1OALGB6SA_331 [Olavius algarvensis spirochete endosymbiont]|nr:hypothetical protein S1OALGB6SA_331 [Olavius algarvensis spirochete endosymbiont]